MLGFFDKYPYTDFHELNLDWLLKEVKMLAAKMHDFEIVNQITYEGSWDITKQYKPWAVVLDTNTNTGYISLKPVPAGISITNTEYWETIANFTALIGDLGNRVIALEQETSDINDVLDDNQIIPAKYAIWIGDSYTMAGSLGGDVDKRFSTLVTNRLGLTEKNYGVGSCGFIKGTTPYTDQLDNAIADFNNNNLDKSLVKYVFISSCRNDMGYGTRGQVATAARYLVTTINSQFPNAQIFITPLLWDWKIVPPNFRIMEYINEIQRATAYGDRVHIIDDGFTWLMGQPTSILYENGGDVHPTVFGHRIIANHIYAAVKGSNWKVSDFAYIPSNQIAHAGISDFEGIFETKDGFTNINFQFTVDNPSGISSGEVWSLTINNLYFNNFFISERGQTDDIYFTLEGHDNGESAKCVLRCSASRSDENTGSYKLQVILYSGTLTNTHKYFARIRIPHGYRDWTNWQ